MHVSSMPTLLIGTLIVGLTVFVSVACVYIVRRISSHPILSENNEFAGFTYPIVGLIYGVFLAFTIIIEWGQFSDAEHSATYEVTYLSELWRDAQVFPVSLRNQIQDRLIAYASAVVENEWSSIASDGKVNKMAENAYEEIWKCYYNFQPKTAREIAFYNESLKQLNELGRQRRQRILYRQSELPTIMWVFLISGGIATISFSYLFGTKHAWSQALIVALLSGLISFSLFLVLSLQHPFTGGLSIKPEAWQELLKSFEERKQQQLIE